MSQRIFLIVVGAAALIGLAVASAAPPTPITAQSFRSFKLPADARFAATPAQIEMTLDAATRRPWKPAVRRERQRGTEDVYAKAAPATVVVRTKSGHGSGFLVSPDGWVVTNYHVAAEAPIDPATGVVTPTVNLGRLGKDGLIQLMPDAIPAPLYKQSEDLDLALLKLSRLPEGLQSLPSLTLANAAPRTGADCVVLGHPSTGMLWTIRQGDISGVGTWPRDMVDVVMQQLALPPSDKASVKAMSASAAPRKVLVSSCQLNPGDSGGPLLNTQGELIGVSFAIPKATASASPGKFAYHVHLDEVKTFLKDRPQAPQLYVPSTWPPGVLAALLDLDEDGVLDTAVFGIEDGKAPTGFLFDLGQKSGPITAADLANPNKRGAWKFAFGIQTGPVTRTFYDTQNQGQPELILTGTDHDHRADSVLRRNKDQWAREDGKGRYLIDKTQFKDEAMSKRLQVIIDRLSK